MEIEKPARKATTIKAVYLLQSIRRRFRSGSFIRPLLLGSYVLTFVHIDDWLWISYSTQVFENLGWSAQSATTTSLLMVIPQAIVSIATLCFFDKFSRRTLIIGPTIISIVCSVLAILGLIHVNLFGIFHISYLLPFLSAIDLSAAAVGKLYLLT